ncbi:hypothetical protein [Actinacidiphila alni]|uniref:hypothetical protein n=1 Tax=Actinacidiphila alni TaxID=380248 RepID=UPI003451EF8E
MSENPQNARVARTAGPDAVPDAELDLEAPEADAAEQRAEVLDTDVEGTENSADPLTPRPADQAEEADPADAAEQRAVVALDEDDYR